MTLGKNKNIIFFLAVISLIFNSNLKSDDKISTVPLINLENLKPSFEENDESMNLNSSIKENIILKEKKK